MQNNNSEQNEKEEIKNDFSKELEEQKKVLDVEKFTQQQEQYRQMLSDANQNSFTENNDPFVWRVGFLRRLGAYLIDGVFIFLCFTVAMFATGIVNEMLDLLPHDMSPMLLATNNTFIELIQNRIMMLLYVVSVIYTSMEVIFARTPGKMLLGIIIGTADKKFATTAQLFTRFAIKNSATLLGLLLVLTAISVLGTLSSVASFVVIIGCLFVLGEKRQALHDTVAKTAVYFKDELEQLDRGN